MNTAGLNGETEGFMIAIQDRVISTRNHQRYIQKLNIPTDMCRKCHIASETIEHVLNGCKLLANSEYLTRHNQVAKIVHQELAQQYELLDKQLPYYQYNPESVQENNNAKLYWDKDIRTDKTIEHNRPDIVLVDKKKRECFLIDVAVPLVHKLEETYQVKKQKYTDLAYEIKKMWHVNKVTIVPVVLSYIAVVP